MVEAMLEMFDEEAINQESQPAIGPKIGKRPITNSLQSGQAIIT
jgi:hypothetical protein